MYVLHEAMQQSVIAEFVKAMFKEIDTHKERKHWVILSIVQTEN